VQYLVDVGSVIWCVYSYYIRFRDTQRENETHASLSIQVVDVVERNLVLLSGGWDSAFCAIVARDRHGNKGVRCFFFDYGQSYCSQELNAVSAICDVLDLHMDVHCLPKICVDERGIFDCRNEKLLIALLEYKPDRIYFGCRNPIALLDRFGDSNWQWARQMRKKYNVRIEIPCLAKPKFWIRRKVLKAGIMQDQIYSTEV
jgi:hypothetical protein